MKSEELLAVAEHMERERGIDRETLIEAIESALMSAAKKGVDQYDEMRVEIDRKTFAIKTYAQKKVVEAVRDEDREVSKWDASKIAPGVEIGDVIEVEVTPEDFGRIAAQTAKQAITHKIRQAEKSRVFDEYKGRDGDIVSGTVRRFDRSDVVIDLGRAEAILSSRERVPTEEYQIGDRIRAYILAVRLGTHGPEILLSRSHPDFVRRLFEIEVTEIADETVVIKGIAREAGFRSKVAVHSADSKVDPVGACVGMRGIRVKNIVRELGGEKIDIVRWSDDIKTLVTNALAPARLSKVLVDEVTKSVNVIVDGDQLSLAIGKKGQNARLTAKLTGWKIDIQKDESDMDFSEKVDLAISKLSSVDGIEREHAELLVQSGFLTIEGLLAAEVEDLEFIEGFDRETAALIKKAAERHEQRSQGRVAI